LNSYKVLMHYSRFEVPKSRLVVLDFPIMLHTEFGISVSLRPVISSPPCLKRTQKVKIPGYFP